MSKQNFVIQKKHIYYFAKNLKILYFSKNTCCFGVFEVSLLLQKKIKNLSSITKSSTTDEMPLTQNKKVQNLLSALLILGVLLIFVPNYFVYSWGMRFAIQIMWFYLLLGLLFLMVSMQRTMLVSFGCCAALCIFLKNASNSSLMFPVKESEMPTFKISHINLTSTDEHFDQTMLTMLRSDATVVSIQELTPILKDTVDASLRKTYPYSIILPRLDLYGLALYSKVPFSKIDTFFYNNIPAIVASLGRDSFERGDQNLVVVSTHTEPPLGNSSYRRLKEHLMNLAARLETIKNPIFLVGDLNVVSWSNEIQEFRAMTNLSDSRRGFMPTYPTNAFAMFSLPIDHIFHSDHFKCIDFKTLSCGSSDHIGIEASFQLATGTQLSSPTILKNTDF